MRSPHGLHRARIIRARRWTLIALLTTLSISTASADTSDRRERVTELARIGRTVWDDFRERLGEVRVRASQSIHAGAEFDDTRLYWHGSGIVVDGAIPLPDRRRALAISVSTAVIVPETNGSNAFLDPSGSNDDPFDPLLDSALRIGGRAEIGRGFSGAMYLGLSARHEIGADIGSALIAGGSVGIEYRRASWLRARLGVGLATPIEDSDLSASPVFQLRIRPHPKVWLETDGTGGRVEWEVSPRTELRLFGGIDQRRYRLDDRTGAIDSGWMEFRTAEVGVGWRRRFGGGIQVSLETAVVLEQRIAILDNDRRTLDARESREPSAAVRVSIAWFPLKRLSGRASTN